MIHEARALLAGAVEMLTPEQEITAPEETWLWQGVLLKADSNMLISLPKVGKTTLLIAIDRGLVPRSSELPGTASRRHLPAGGDRRS